MMRAAAVARVLTSTAVVMMATTAVCGAASPAQPAGAPTFLGSAACGGCHGGEMAAWRGSHHDLAMEEATAETVLGTSTTSASRMPA
jgi:hypothetical protein